MQTAVFHFQTASVYDHDYNHETCNNGFSGNSGAAETSLTFEVDVVNSPAAAAHLLVEFLATWWRSNIRAHLALVLGSANTCGKYLSLPRLNFLCSSLSCYLCLSAVCCWAGTLQWSFIFAELSCLLWKNHNDNLKSYDTFETFPKSNQLFLF